MEETITTSTNKSNRDIVVKYWNLGPEVAYIFSKDNKDYWTKLAKIWNVSEEEARRQLCANCEYYDNTPEMMKVMETIPFDKFDLDGGGRGFCHKFDFICHNLRTCQAWEKKDFELKDKEEEKKLPDMSFKNKYGNMNLRSK